MAKKKERAPLFEVPTIQENEWQGMPEYSQKDLTSFQHIVIHFQNKEDVQKFAKLLDRKITSRTNSLWFPQIAYMEAKNKRYADES